ncbi:MAG: hypothetical protein PVF58_19625 [Candidatus Methanofastidiosia archaeon]|jgi:hypothetical protein
MSNGFYGEQEEWHYTLYQMLNSGEYDKEEVVEFIEKNIPKSESLTFDYKSELYLTSEYPEEKNKRTGKFIKLISALSNVHHNSKYRFIFVGFNSNGQFEGIKYRNEQGGDHIFDVDESVIQHLLNEYLIPTPKIERYFLKVREKRGIIILVEKCEKPPILIKKGLKIAKGKKSIICEGQMYTRKGSTTKLMKYIDIRDIIERREEIFNKTFRKIANDLSNVISLSSDELENINLTVTDSEIGIPVKEYITTKPAKNINEKLTTCVKNWNSSGELISSRRTLYEFYQHRNDLELTNEKAEFLIRSSFANNLPGSEWLMNYEDDSKKIFKDIIDDGSYNMISTLEKILLILGELNLLKSIEDKYSSKYISLKATEYIKICNKGIKIRLGGYVNSPLSFNQKTLSLDDLLQENNYIEELLDSTIKKLIEDDTSPLRKLLKDVDLVRFAKWIQEK